jgi:hypothetical protein
MAKKVDLDDYYTAKKATQKLSENAGREIKPDYVRSLARYGKVRTVGEGNAKLYLKADIDAYVVADRPGPRVLMAGVIVRESRSGRTGGRPRK